MWPFRSSEAFAVWLHDSIGAEATRLASWISWTSRISGTTLVAFLSHWTRRPHGAAAAGATIRGLMATNGLKLEHGVITISLVAVEEGAATRNIHEKPIYNHLYIYIYIGFFHDGLLPNYLISPASPIRNCQHTIKTHVNSAKTLWNSCIPSMKPQSKTKIPIESNA